MIDEIERDRMTADQLRDHLVLAERECGACIAILHFLCGGGAGLALFPRHHDRRLGPAGRHRIEPGKEGREAGALRTGDIGAGDGFRQIQSGGRNASILPVLKGGAGGGKEDRIDMRPVFQRVGGRKAVPPRFHRHGDRVFIPIGHRAFANPARARREPGIGGSNRLALQPAQRNVSPVSGNPCHFFLSFRMVLGPENQV